MDNEWSKGTDTSCTKRSTHLTAYHTTDSGAHTSASYKSTYTST